MPHASAIAQTPTPFTLIQTPARLDEEIARWREAPWLAVDTEFVREETYVAHLCLIQVSDGRGAACVDVLSADPAPLIRFLIESGSTKVFHSGSQDLELFVQHGGDTPKPLFDTQIAAALLGHGEQLGYAALVERRLGLAVDKSLSRTDWSRRPLSDAQLAYAADDVHHLAALYPALRAELEDRGRLAWLEAECERIADPQRYRPDPAGAWRMLKGLGKLPAEAQHRAARLATWRENEAARSNRPRRWILDDVTVLQLALKKPSALGELSGIEALSARRIERSGAQLLELIAQPVTDAAPLVPELRDTPEQKAKVQLLLAALREKAEREQLAPTLVATRSDIERLVREGPSAPILLLEGWRREAFGEELLKLL